MDKYDIHEALDRTEMLSTVFDQYVRQAPAVVANPKLAVLAEKISDTLGELYQELGALDAQED